jgi:ATP-dependent Lhr-like helicase
VRFAACWQHVAAGSRAEGRAGLLAVIEQLQGLEVAAGEWERSVLPARVVDYDPRWLDELCLGGEVAWGRLTPRPDGPPGLEPEPGIDDGLDSPLPRGGRRGSATPSSATPLALVTRPDLTWMLAAVRADRSLSDPPGGAAADILAALRTQGARFRSELAGATGRLDAEIDEGLWDLVARGIVTADAFSAVRSLLSARRYRPGGRPGSSRRRALGRQRALVGSGVGEGRWSLLPEPDAAGTGPHSGPASEELAEAVAWQLLARWGVVAWELWSRESYRIPWRDVVRALRRLEARGEAMGGRFVAGISGEQYALPEAAALLAEVRRDPGRGAEVEVAGTDPLNLTGTLLGGPRVPSIRDRTVRYRSGVPDTTMVASTAV